MNRDRTLHIPHLQLVILSKASPVILSGPSPVILSEAKNPDSSARGSGESGFFASLRMTSGVLLACVALALLAGCRDSGMTSTASAQTSVPAVAVQTTKPETKDVA